MFAAALIVFRESLEAALIIGVMAAATRSIPERTRWLVAGVAAGVLGAILVASSMEALSEVANGIGQELFSACVLVCAIAMLAWHNIWMSAHGRELASSARQTAQAIENGMQERSVILLIVALAVLREGSETALFLFGIATSSDNSLHSTLLGGLVGLLAGSAVGALLYAGLLRIPLKWFFAATSALVMLLAAGMASQVARLLSQADLLSSWSAPLWDTSAVLSHDSPAGTLLHGLIGYDPQPTGWQVVFYVVTLLLIATATYGVKRLTPSPLRMPQG